MLKIDNKLRKLLRPLSKEERQELEESLLSEGCREPLAVWVVGKDEVVLDGHNRLELCREHDISFKTRAVKGIETREQAEDWIDKNQLARRNQTPSEFRMILGRRYNRAKKMRQKNLIPGGPSSNVPLEPSRNQAKNGDSGKGETYTTANQIGAEHGVSGMTVRRAGLEAEVAEALIEIDPEIEAHIEEHKPKRQQFAAAKKLIIGGELQQAHDVLLKGPVRKPKRRIVRLTKKRYNAILSRCEEIMKWLDVPAHSMAPIGKITHEMRKLIEEFKKLTPVRD